MKQIRQMIVEAVAHEYVNQHLAKMVKEGKEASTEWCDWCVNHYLFGNIMASVGLGALDENDELVRDISYQIFRKLDDHQRCLRHTKETLAKELAAEKDRVTEFEELADEVEKLVAEADDIEPGDENPLEVFMNSQKEKN